MVGVGIEKCSSQWCHGKAQGHSHLDDVWPFWHVVHQMFRVVVCGEKYEEALEWPYGHVYETTTVQSTGESINVCP